jgi:hypothetical protein
MNCLHKVLRRSAQNQGVGDGDLGSLDWLFWPRRPPAARIRGARGGPSRRNPRERMENLDTGYGGPERRRHKMFVTRNTEYHFRDEVCIAVRDRKSGRWLASHLALQRRLAGSVRFEGHGCAIPLAAPPEVGDALFFGVGGRELVTSLLCAIERPERQLTLEYANGGD